VDYSGDIGSGKAVHDGVGAVCAGAVCCGVRRQRLLLESEDV